MTDDQRTMLTPQQMHLLMSSISENRVSSRSVSGRNQSYVEAHDIKAMLIRVFGFGGFSAEVIDSKILDIRDDGRQGVHTSGAKSGQLKTPYVMAQSTVRLTIFGLGPQGQDAVYTETAVGTNDGNTIGDVADNAIKSAASDALKRCAIYLGTQFGLSLYKNGTKFDTVGWVYQPEQEETLKQVRSQAEAPPQERVQQIETALGGTRDEAAVTP